MTHSTDRWHGIRRGLGLYPDSPCFDQTRPSWLPYWIDDFQESKCFYNSDSILGAVPGAAGQMAGVAVSSIGEGVGDALTKALKAAVPTSLTGVMGLAAIAVVAVILLKR